MKNMVRFGLAIMLTMMASVGYAQYFSPSDPVGTKCKYVITTEMKDAPTSVAIQVVELVAKNGNMLTLKESTGVEVDGVSTMEQEYETTFRYEEEGYYSDPDVFVTQTISQLESMGVPSPKVEFDGTIAVTPLKGEVGQELPLSDYSTKVTVMGMPLITSSKETSSKVIRTEKVEVPAGTFDTFVYVTESEVTTEGMGQNGTVKYITTTWTVPGKGMVKSIVESDNGYKGVQILEEVIRP